MKLYIYRFTDTGLMIHSYTVKSLQPQNRVEQSRAEQSRYTDTCFSYNAVTIQVYSHKCAVTEPHGYM